MSRWYLEVAREADGWNISTAGSFRRALAHRLQQSLDTALAHVLAALDRNYDLLSFYTSRKATVDDGGVRAQKEEEEGDGSSEESLFVQLLSETDLMPVILSTAGGASNSNNAHALLLQQDRHFPFAAKFPFSFALFRRMEELIEMVDQSA